MNLLLRLKVVKLLFIWLLLYNTMPTTLSEAAVGGIKNIMESCMRSNTVKKLIYTTSVMAASPLKEDGSSYKKSMDETCWTSLNHSYAYSNEYYSEYINSKTLTEKEGLSYNGKGIQVVSLACGLIGGDTIQSTMAYGSMAVLISQDIAAIIQKFQPNISIHEGFIEDTKRETLWGSRKMEEIGFEYQYGLGKLSLNI